VPGKFGSLPYLCYLVNPILWRWKTGVKLTLLLQFVDTLPSGLRAKLPTI
jgi:hypothetical protein